MNTRKSLFVALVFAIFAAVLIPAAFAQDSAVSVSTGGVVNVRSGPGMAYTIRGVLQGSAAATGRNAAWDNRHCAGDERDMDMWIQINLKGIEGWVNRCAVQVRGNINSLTVAQPMNAIRVESLNPLPEEAIAGPDNDTRPEDAAVLGFTQARVNVRNAPGLNGAVIAVAPAIEDVYVIGRTADNTWLQISYDGKTGWVAGYLMLMSVRGWEEVVPVR